LVLLLASATWSIAQVPPPAAPAAPPGPALTPPSGNPAVRSNTSFFSRFGTNRPVAPSAPGALPPGTLPGTTVIPPRTPGAATPGGLGTLGGPSAPGAPGTGVATNVVPKGISEGIPAGLIRWQEADLSQVLEFYADLIDRTVLKS